MPATATHPPPLSAGVGMSANQVYREDGTPCSAHEYEDRSIHFCLDRENHTYLYAVFDGHDGAKAAYFASQVGGLPRVE